MSQKTCNAFCNLCRNHCVETVGIGHLMGSYYCSELTCTLLFNTYIGHKIILYITSYRYLTCDEVKACMYVSRFSLHFILLNKQAKRNGAASIKNKHSTQTQRENDTVFCLKIRPVGSNKPQSQSRVSPVGKTRQKNKTGNEVIKCPVTFIRPVTGVSVTHPPQVITYTTPSREVASYLDTPQPLAFGLGRYTHLVLGLSVFSDF